MSPPTAWSLGSETLSPPAFRFASAALYVVGRYRYDLAMNPPDLITVNPEILGGTPVFKGTRVPVRTMFEYLADSLSLDYFLESFPTVRRELAVAVLRQSREHIEQQAAA